MRPVPALGIGVTFDPGLEAVLEAGAGLMDVIEVEPQGGLHPSRSSSQRRQALDDLGEVACRAAPHVTAHCVVAPVGSSEPPQEDECDWLSQIEASLTPAWISEHLSFNEVWVDGFRRGAGFLMPPHQTDNAVQNAVSNLRLIQTLVDRPVLFETGVNYFPMRSDEMPDGTFWRAVSEGADCGILLDLHNLWTNHRNGRSDIQTTLAQIPLDRVQELHLAGGEELDGFWTDAHSGMVDPDLVEIARELIPQLPSLGAVIFEIMPSRIARTPDFAPQLRTQLEEIRELWEAGESARPSTHTPVTIADAYNTGTGITLPENRWPSKIDTERALACAKGIDADAAVGRSRQLYTTLIDASRKGLILRVANCTVRCLGSCLGRSGLEDLVTGYLRNCLPAIRGADEGRQFLNYVQANELSKNPNIFHAVQLDLKTLGFVHQAPTSAELALAQQLHRMG